jgi:hypothetical protein
MATVAVAGSLVLEQMVKAYRKNSAAGLVPRAAQRHHSAGQVLAMVRSLLVGRKASLDQRLRVDQMLYFVE